MKPVSKITATKKGAVMAIERWEVRLGADGCWGHHGMLVVRLVVNMMVRYWLGGIERYKIRGVFG